MLGVGRAVLRPDASDRMRRDRLREAKPFASAATDAVVTFEGRVECGEAPALIAPISGKPVVWLRIVVLEDKGGENFTELYSITESQPFSIVGGSVEEHVSVRAPADGVAISGQHESTGPVVGVSERMREFLARHGKDDDSRDGFTRRREYRESALHVQQPLFALGTKRARTDTAAPASLLSSDYRTAVTRADDDLVPEWLASPSDRRSFEQSLRIGVGSVFAFLFISFVLVGPLVFGVGSCISSLGK